MIFSDTENGAYNDYLKNEMEKRGINYSSVRTWDYAHLGQGNLHCSSHTIPYCRPRKKE